MVTDKPLACSSLANEEAIMPLPNDEATPPVTKYILSFLLLSAQWHRIK